MGLVFIYTVITHTTSDMDRKKIFSGLTALALTVTCFTSTPAHAAGPNLIQNPSFETGSDATATNWTTNSFGSSTVAFSISTSSVHTGVRAATIDVSNYTNGDAKWVHEPVTVTPGSYYTMSLWYKSSVQSALYARYNNSDVDGTSTGFHWLADIPASDAWTEYTGSITIPAGVTAIQLIQTLESNGSLTIDDYSLTLEEAPTFSEGRVTFTFDDGWQSIYDNARPILNAAGIRTTQYVYSDAMNQVHGPIYMTAPELLEMQAEGHDIDAHSRSHADLTTLSGSALTNEIGGSRSDLIAAGFSPVDSYAYPYGAYNSDIRQQMIDAGFLGARTVDEGYNYADSDKYTLKIQHVTNTTSASTIKGWIDTARSEKSWLILMFHEIRTASTTCAGDDVTECATTDVLQEVASYVTAPATEICILTMSEALNNVACGSTSTPTNQAPVVANPIPDQDATEDTLFSHTFSPDTFTDADNDPLTYTATTPLWLSFDASTRTFTGTPTNADVGIHAVTVTATDTTNASTTDSFTVTVANSNGAPTIATAAFSIPENSVTGTVVGTTTANDSDTGDTLTYEIVSGNTSGAFSLDATTGTITVAQSSALDFETSPAFTLVIKVTDSSSLSAQATTTITLTDVAENTPNPDPTPTPQPSSGGGNGGGGGGGVVLGLIGQVVTNLNNTVPTITTNGVVLGTSTQNFLFTKPLYWGMYGEDVVELHKILISQGYLKISAPTGYFGPLTFAAVKLYQQAHGIDMVGVVGPITRASLNSSFGQ